MSNVCENFVYTRMWSDLLIHEWHLRIITLLTRRDHVRAKTYCLACVFLRGGGVIV